MLKMKFLALIFCFSLVNQAQAMLVLKRDYTSCQEGRQVVKEIREFLATILDADFRINIKDKEALIACIKNFADDVDHIYEKEMSCCFELFERLVKDNEALAERYSKIKSLSAQAELTIVNMALFKHSPALLQAQNPNPQGATVFMRRTTMFLMNAATLALLGWNLYQYEQGTRLPEPLINIASICASYMAYNYSTSPLVVYAGLFNIVYQYNVMLGTRENLENLVRILTEC